jgi:hypothetical protein
MRVRGHWFSKMTYSEKLKDPRWILLREDILERDGYKCRDCGTDEGPLQVHHCAYVGKDPWETPPGLLMSVCDKCHWNRQGTEDEARVALGFLFARCSEPDARRIMKRIEDEADVVIEMRGRACDVY